MCCGMGMGGERISPESLHFALSLQLGKGDEWSSNLTFSFKTNTSQKFKDSCDYKVTGKAAASARQWAGCMVACVPLPKQRAP